MNTPLAFSAQPRAFKQVIKKAAPVFTQEKIKEAQLRSCAVMFSIQVLDNDIDEMEKTLIYRGEVKKYANLLRKALEKDLNGGFFKLYQEDPELITNISDKLCDLSRQVSEMPTSDRIFVSQEIPKILMKKNKNITLKKLDR